ncbi:MAG: response regulator [Flavobacteriales bacterium]|nr:response regulator [Flavobacteriales bacterium]
MRAMLTANPAGDKGLRFYRLMGLIGMVITVFFAVVFLGIYDTGKELIWDRVLVFLASAIVYGLSWSNSIQAKVIYRISNINFYIFTIQVIFATAFNAFEFTYLVSLLLAIQAITISFRSEQQAGQYLTFVVLASGLGLAVVPPHNMSGAFIFVTMIAVATLMWITVRIKVKFQKSFKVHEELLRTIVSKTENSIFITDFEGVIFDMNDPGTDMFGYSREEIIGENFSLLRKHALTEEEDHRGVTEMLNNKFWNSDIELRRKDGSAFMAYVNVALIHKFGNQFLVYRVKDITAEKEFEREIINAKEKAEEAVRIKSQFLATMSHEIRTPMNGVIGMTSMLQRTKLNAQQANYVDTIQKSGENLLVIINDILDFSKIESGKIELDNHRFNLHEMLTDILELLSPIAAARQLDMALKIGADVPNEIVADSTRLKQVLINLINNAIKFTHKGSVHIAVKKGRKNMLKFSIKDTGIGIPDEKMATLFDSFTQVDSSTTRKYGGTGLGLSICKELVHIMGGGISVTSQVEKGSQFEFSIAFENADSHDDTGNREEEELDQLLATLDLPNRSILIAEDNIINQQVAIMLLENLGARPVVVSNGAEAFAKCRESDFELVLMDIQMPEMDGIEATRLILEMDKEHQPVIIALTANAMKSDRDECKAAGMRAFLSKPILVEALKKILVEAFSEVQISEKGDN